MVFTVANNISGLYAKYTFLSTSAAVQEVPHEGHIRNAALAVTNIWARNTWPHDKTRVNKNMCDYRSKE